MIDNGGYVIYAFDPRRRGPEMVAVVKRFLAALGIRIEDRRTRESRPSTQR
jgi:hypothetical protein